MAKVRQRDFLNSQAPRSPSMAIGPVLRRSPQKMTALEISFFLFSKLCLAISEVIFAFKSQVMVFSTSENLDANLRTVGAYLH